MSLSFGREIFLGVSGAVNGGLTFTAGAGEAAGDVGFGDGGAISSEAGVNCTVQGAVRSLAERFKKQVLFCKPNLGK